MLSPFRREQPCEPRDCIPPGSSVQGILQQEHWSGLLCWPPGDLSNPGIRPKCLPSPALAGGFFITVPHGKTTQGRLTFRRNAHGSWGRSWNEQRWPWTWTGSNTGGTWPVASRAPCGEGHSVSAGASAKGPQRPRGVPPANSHQPSAPGTPGAPCSPRRTGPATALTPGARDSGAGGHHSDLAGTLS